ncbi:Uncharacterised protein [Avibacterium paragallinarum]|uniref:HTH cro/C1-type domain-containing protein n=2 Tax=Avibacterium paragallinarum TaxID=728 RepID=A0A380Z2A1_AVIPA|nr:Uncharacterised protein [Avibacterium paragallinarum]
MTEIIEQIKQIIESGEINRMQLAKEIGVTPPVISSYLNGKYTGIMTKSPIFGRVA